MSGPVICLSSLSCKLCVLCSFDKYLLSAIRKHCCGEYEIKSTGGLGIIENKADKSHKNSLKKILEVFSGWVRWLLSGFLDKLIRKGDLGKSLQLVSVHFIVQIYLCVLFFKEGCFDYCFFCNVNF